MPLGPEFNLKKALNNSQTFLFHVEENEKIKKLNFFHIFIISALTKNDFL